MVTTIARRGALAAIAGARVRTALGRGNVFDGAGNQRTFGQIGDFSAARRVAGGALIAQGPDAVYPAARVEARTVDFSGVLGYQFETGSTAFAVLVPVDCQSNGIGATAGGTDSDSGATATLYNTVAPMDHLWCFNNGVFPLRASPGGWTALATAILPADIASFVPAREGIFLQRDVPLFSTGLIIADALRGTPHKVVVYGEGIGSTSLADRLIRFTGSRAGGTVSISGPTATFQVTSGSITAKAGLILTGTGIAANTVITGLLSGDPAGNCMASVSISQTVGSVTFATQDPEPRQKQNFIAALDSFAALARAQNLTPIMPFFFWIGGEAESATAAKANGINTLRDDLVAVVDSFAARLYAGTPNAGRVPVMIDSAVSSPDTAINQSPASNVGNANPSLANMGRVNPMCLASGAMAREVDAAGARYSTRWVATTPYFQPAEAGARVHYGPDSRGHIFIGESLGMTALQVANVGVEAARWPAITQVTRVKGSTTVTVTLSEACEFDGEELVADPGQKGFRYTGGGSVVAITGVSVAGTTVTLTLATEPTGVEVLSYACDNATQRIAPVINPAWPHGEPMYGIGPLDGQRGNLRAVALWGYSLQTGRPCHRYLFPYKREVEVTAGTGTMLALHQAAGITPAFLIDAGDAASVASGNQTITDRGGAALYWMGIDGTSANDPVYMPAAGNIPAWLKFDSGGAVTAKSGQMVRAQGAATALDKLHRAFDSNLANLQGAALFAAAFQMPVLTPASTQYLLANCRNASGGGAGVAFRVSTAGRFGINVRGAGGSSVFSYNLPVGSEVEVGWNVVVMAVRDGGNVETWFSKSSRYQATLLSSACAFATPDTGNPEAAPVIGGNYQAAVVNIDTLVNGSGVGGVAVGQWVDATTSLMLFRALCARFGLTVGPLP